MSYKVLNKVKVFLYSTLSGLRFNLGGQLGVNEILAISDSFSLKKWSRIHKQVPDAKKITIAYLIFLFAQIVSDIVNHSSTSDFIRGWANIGVALVVTSFLIRCLFKTSSLILVYLAGEIVKILIFGENTEGVSLEDMGFFKFQVVPILNACVLIISWFLLKKSHNNIKAVVITLFVYGLFSVAFDARSNGMFWILTGFIVMRAKSLVNITFKKALPYFLLFAIVFQGLYSLYVSSVLSGDLGGKHATEQFKMVSNPYNPVSLLITGRAETFVAMSAIADAPIFGHGSWAPDKNGKYTFMLYQMHSEESRFNARFQNSESLIIPTHSVLMGTWASGGIVAFIAVLYIFCLAVGRCIALLKARPLQRSPMFPIVVYFLFNLIWSFLFSPLPHIKQTLPIMIALIVVLHKKLVDHAVKEKSGKAIHPSTAQDITVLDHSIYQKNIIT